MNPSAAEIVAEMNPRLKEVLGYGWRVFVETKEFPFQIELNEDGIPIAVQHWCGGVNWLPLNDYFFDTLVFEGQGYTVEQALSVFGVDINLGNYKGMITTLHKKR